MPRSYPFKIGFGYGLPGLGQMNAIHEGTPIAGRSCFRITWSSASTISSTDYRYIADDPADLTGVSIDDPIEARVSNPPAESRLLNCTVTGKATTKQTDDTLLLSWP